MARGIIRSSPLYVDGLKVGEVENGTYDIESGDEIQIGSDGVIGISDGVITCSIKFSAIVPVKGMQTNLTTALLAKRYVSVGLPVDGHFHEVEGRIMSGSYAWSSKNGTLVGSFSFIGAQPEIT